MENQVSVPLGRTYGETTLYTVIHQHRTREEMTLPTLEQANAAYWTYLLYGHLHPDTLRDVCALVDPNGNWYGEQEDLSDMADRSECLEALCGWTLDNLQDFPAVGSVRTLRARQPLYSLYGLHCTQWDAMDPQSPCTSFSRIR